MHLLPRCAVGLGLLGLRRQLHAQEQSKSGDRRHSRTTRSLRRRHRMPSAARKRDEWKFDYAEAYDEHDHC